MTRVCTNSPEGARTCHGRDNLGNHDVLSDNWYVLRKAIFDVRHRDGTWSRQEREAYDRGNGATLLLFDRTRRTVVLTRQFRAPAYLNGHPDGRLIEAPAGLLEAEDADTAIRREVEEETGYRVTGVTRLFELFMSPGSVTERVAFYADIGRSPRRRWRRGDRGRGSRGARDRPRRGVADGRAGRDRGRQDGDPPAVGHGATRSCRLRGRVAAHR
jgi:nudix-type nucleoside diphosphatase (YffH/AdpP family)